ncbi:hypothetical protein Dsin_017971 [Dipteronia sinensis]|uniref:HAT C-terminal dimerisation domain-containing protein n=1 Tax=Dipteronia sinensis TaxID=43782 RepID=A0AAE0AHF1_9ROSI|nr:hypothetical protein Dsin_017971 [Dipteronia sinensis]
MEDVHEHDTMDPLTAYDLFVSSTSNVDGVKSELDYYLEESALPRAASFDILAWWRTNGIKYPVLQRVAKDILAVSISTVASELAFSTGGRPLSPHRNMLNPKTLEATGNGAGMEKASPTGNPRPSLSPASLNAGTRAGTGMVLGGGDEDGKAFPDPDPAPLPSLPGISIYTNLIYSH